jgi:uncharacterized membrane protein
MSQKPELARVTFALALIGLGGLGVVFADFALQWQPVPDWLPARHALAYVSAAILLFTGLGIVVARTQALASRVLFAYSLVWLALKLPSLVTNPLLEANWLGAGELAVIAAACWVLATSDPRQRRIARYVFGVSLIPIGLSHFFYRPETLVFVPTWLPFRSFWANLGGAGHIAAGLGVLFGIVPRVAATLEAAMIGAFTALVWLPGVINAPTNRLQWTGLLMSWIIGAAAWVIARSIAPRDEDAVDAKSVRAPEGVFTASGPTSRV